MKKPQVKEILRKWCKDLIKDAQRESNMDEQRLEKMPLHLHLALNRDEIRLNKKEGK